VRAKATLDGAPLFGQPMPAAGIDGYEIHLGQTEYDAGTSPLFRLRREGASGLVADGAQNDTGRVIGTYLHGLFDDDSFRHAVVRACRTAAGLAPPSALAPHRADRERRFDDWALHVRRALDVERIKQWIS
jgi:adenosylcobyric acid synthase